MKIVFLGTPDFAVPSLEAIISAGFDLQLVITQPDRPKGRSKTPQPPPVKVLAEAHGIPVLQPKSVNADDIIDNLKKLKPDVTVVVAFGQILSSRFIDLPEKVCVNVHASLLPRHRGAAPVQAAILAGDEQTGVTIQKVVRKLDAGDILRQEATRIQPDENAGELLARLSSLGAMALIEALEDLKAGREDFRPQDESLVTYMPMLKKSDGKIDWHRDAEYLARHVRAMTPWPGAFTFMPRGKQPLRILVKQAAAAQGTKAAQPGDLIDVTEQGLLVQTGEGALLVQELQPGGKKQMTASEFARGYRLQPGDKFAEA